MAPTKNIGLKNVKKEGAIVLTLLKNIQVN